MASELDSLCRAARAKLRHFDNAATCAACGSGEVLATFKPRGHREWGDLMERVIGVSTSFVPFRLIVRTCSRCRHEWAELPLDAEASDG
jgi:hypothetical protein